MGSERLTHGFGKACPPWVRNVLHNIYGKTLYLNCVVRLLETAANLVPMNYPKQKHGATGDFLSHWPLGWWNPY